jgi:hypothetical protein
LGKHWGSRWAQAICLLCLERDPEHCHRLIVAERMTKETGQEIRHLFVDF